MLPDGTADGHVKRSGEPALGFCLDPRLTRDRIDFLPHSAGNSNADDLSCRDGYDHGSIG